MNSDLEVNTAEFTFLMLLKGYRSATKTKLETVQNLLHLNYPKLNNKIYTNSAS